MRMIAASVDLLVQIGIVNEVRRVTAIARVDKKLHSGEAWFNPIWRLDPNAPADAPSWGRTVETEKTT